MVQEVFRKPQCILQIPRIVRLKAFSWEGGVFLAFILVLVTFVITNRSCSETFGFQDKLAVYIEKKVSI